MDISKNVLIFALSSKTKTMNDIKLPNRYGQDVTLAHVDEALYKFVSDCEYISTHYDNMGKLVAIDPEGGPMISEGAEISDGFIVESVFWDEVSNCYFVVNKNH